MKKSKQRIQSKSNASIISKTSSKYMGVTKEDICVPPLDTLTVKILGLQLTDESSRLYAIKVTFFDQLLVSGIIKPTLVSEKSNYKVVATGMLNYDPSDYEKMCLYADNPLIVIIQPLNDFESGFYDGQSNTPLSTISSHSPSDNMTKGASYYAVTSEISCCNVDILPLFIDVDSMSMKKRMQPMMTPSILHCKSWDNLPLITITIEVIRNPINSVHHTFLKTANYMKITLVGAYNMLISHESSLNYMAATKLPLYNPAYSSPVLFNKGYAMPPRFDSTNFYPKWESLRLAEDMFNKGEEKFSCELGDLQNESNIDMKHYLNEVPKSLITIWGSFHRTLMLGDSEIWLWNQLLKWSWPFEIHIFAENSGYSFMAFLNLCKLLYPGESVVRLAVPLQWFNVQSMRINCNCEVVLSPTIPQKASKATTQSGPTSVSTDSGIIRTTGSDENPAFIIVEVKLARPLRKLAPPPRQLAQPVINEMLETMEQRGRDKRECTGRGQLTRHWRSTVRAAATALRSVPHVGMTDFCSLFRQLSETRTRVELLTSFWMDAAVYINDNFVLQEFLKSDEMFEEMTMMAHACLMKVTLDTIIGVDDKPKLETTLKAARQARQMQDIPHALALYLLDTSENVTDENSWRELATCMQEVDKDWGTVCINKALMLNIRHPLTLLMKACMIFEEDPDEAEPFFLALLAWYPFWSTVWVIANAYFCAREHYLMADQIMVCLTMAQGNELVEDMHFSRAWGHEISDWWDSTPLLSGMSQYYDAADLLLRIRAIRLAEECLAKALLDTGETAAYFHLVALCCRLQGKIDDALCHIHRGIAKFGEIGYLRSLEAECYHKKSDPDAAKICCEKVGNHTSAYNILMCISSWDSQHTQSVLVDLVRQQPSAYSWMALAENWLQRAQVGEGGDASLSDDQRAAVNCATAYAVEALKCDRRASKAWALLSRLVKPSARRLYCRNTAIACGYEFKDDKKEYCSASGQSLCHRVGWVLPVCTCRMCELVKL